MLDPVFIANVGGAATPFLLAFAGLGILEIADARKKSLRLKAVEGNQKATPLELTASKTSSEADEWKGKFYHYRDFLVSVINGTSELSSDKQLYKFIELLEIHDDVLPEHQGTLSFSGFETDYMSLTYIYGTSSQHFGEGKMRYRSTPTQPEVAAGAVENFRSIATGYRGSLESGDKYTREYFHKCLNGFLQEYAAHLLLHYRKSPTESSPGPSRAEIEERYARQDSLHRLASKLEEMSKRFTSKASLSGLEDAKTAISNLVDERHLNPEAVELTGGTEKQFEERLEEFASYGLKEARVQAYYQEAERPLKDDELKDAERNLDKFFSAVAAEAKAEALEGEQRQQVLRLAEQNKGLAREALDEAFSLLSLDEASELVRELRIDNKYLLGRQQKELTA